MGIYYVLKGCNGSVLRLYGFEKPEWSLDHGQSSLEV